MFEKLRDAIEGLAVPVEGEAIAEVLRLRERLDARLAEAIGAFDEAELYDDDGATSTTAWLRNRGLSGPAAGRELARARALRRLPVTAAAFEAGDLRAGHVDAVVANTRGELLDRFAVDEEALVPRLARLDVGDARIAMQHWRTRATHGDPGDEDGRRLHLSRLGDGQFVLDATFELVGGETIARAIGLATSPDAEGEPARSPARRRADALVDVCRHFLDHQRTRRGGRHRPHLNLIVHADGDATMLDGRPVPTSVRNALLCDAALHRVWMSGEGVILDYGRATRTIPPTLFNALAVRDGGCRFPGCDRPPEWTEVHHVQPWQEGGTTDLGNTNLECVRHHHKLHQPGWEMKQRPDGVVEVTSPDGTVLMSWPRGPNPPRLA